MSAGGSHITSFLLLLQIKSPLSVSDLLFLSRRCGAALPRSLGPQHALRAPQSSPYVSLSRPRARGPHARRWHYKSDLWRRVAPVARKSSGAARLAAPARGPAQPPAQQRTAAVADASPKPRSAEGGGRIMVTGVSELLLPPPLASFGAAPAQMGSGEGPPPAMQQAAGESADQGVLRCIDPSHGSVCPGEVALIHNTRRTALRSHESSPIT